MLARRFPPFVLMVLLAALAPLPVLAADKDQDYDEFLRRMVDEARVIQQARALAAKSALKKPPTPEQALLSEERVRHELRRLQAEQAQQARAAKKAPEPRVDVTKAARELVEKERRRAEELQADRVGRLLASAKAHARKGRLRAAERALLAAVREDPSNKDAAKGLEAVRKEREAEDERRTEAAMQRETAASLRDVDRSRIPYAAALTLPDDGARRSARAKAAAAKSEEGKAAAEQTAVRKALAKTISIEATQMPVADVAAYLRHVADLNIIVEKEAADKTVDLQLRDTSVETVLDWMTKLAGMSYAVKEGVVHIGPPARVAMNRVLKIYDVSDVLHVRRLLQRGRKRKLRPTFDPFEGEEEKGMDEIAKDLMDFLKEVTGRDHWGDDPGKAQMNIRLGRLVVNAGPEMQAKISRVLDHVRD